MKTFQIIGTISETARACVAHITPFMAIAILPCVATYYIEYEIYAENNAPETLSFITIVVTLFLHPFINAAIAHGVLIDACGRRPRLSEMFFVGGRFCLPFVGLSIVSQCLIGAGFFLFLIPGCILISGWSVAQGVLLDEKIGIITSMRRSWEITRGHRLRIFGFIVIIAIVAIGLLCLMPGIFWTPQNRWVYILGGGSLEALRLVIVFVAATQLYVALRALNLRRNMDPLASVFD